MVAFYHDCGRDRQRWWEKPDSGDFIKVITSPVRLKNRLGLKYSFSNNDNANDMIRPATERGSSHGSYGG